MNSMLRTLLIAAGIAVAGQAAAEVTFFNQDGFRGRNFTANQTIPNLDRTGFNDKISSVIVRSGAWEVCTDAGFAGRCVVLRPGRYPTLAAAGIEDSISSIRPARRHAQNYGQNYRSDSYAFQGGDNRFRDNDRYQYREDGWRYDRYENRWERY